MKDLMTRMAALEERVAEKERRERALERRLRGWRWSAIALAAGLLLAPIQVRSAGSSASVNSRLRALELNLGTYGQRLAAVEGRVTPLEQKLEHFSIQTIDSQYSVVLSGANLYVVNGTGSTASANGLGNLIVGYNALRDRDNIRTGSHYLILGDRQNYASYGGIVAGYENYASGSYASITGGIYGWAAGSLSSITGGAHGWANGNYSSVNGGSTNLADGGYSSVTGGYNNVASGYIASVSGGHSQLQSANFGWAGGSLHSP